MRRLTQLAGAVAMAGIIAAAPAVAQGKHDRAKMAMAAAQAKITTATNLGIHGDGSQALIQAQAALRSAHEDLSAGHKEASIRDANHAAELADMAMAHAKQQHDAAMSAQRENTAAVVGVAQQQAANAQASAEAANDRAAAANARANAAERAATAAQAQAEAATAANVKPVAATTVTTRTTSSGTTRTTVHHPVVHHKVLRHRVVHHTVVRHPAATTTTTTTVSSNS